MYLDIHHQDRLTLLQRSIKIFTETVGKGVTLVGLVPLAPAERGSLSSTRQEGLSNFRRTSGEVDGLFITAFTPNCVVQPTALSSYLL